MCGAEGALFPVARLAGILAALVTSSAWAEPVWVLQSAKINPWGEILRREAGVTEGYYSERFKGSFEEITVAEDRLGVHERRQEHWKLDMDVELAALHRLGLGRARTLAAGHLPTGGGRERAQGRGDHVRGRALTAGTAGRSGVSGTLRESPHCMRGWRAHLVAISAPTSMMTPWYRGNSA